MLEKVYRAEVEIAASPEAVWAVLVDLDAYPSWNPFTIATRSSLEVGAPVDLTVRMELRGETRTQREHVRRHERPHALDWGMHLGARALLFGERTQRLTPTAGGCRYVTEDTIGGLLAPLVHRLYGPSLERGFSAMASALAREVERRART